MSETTPGVSQSLARFVTDLSTPTVPAEVIHQAKRCLLDHLGVGLAGSRDPSARIVHAAAARIGCRGGAHMLGTSVQASAPMAALANGVAAHVFDYDDTFNPGDTTVHASGAVWPAVLATASLRPTNGADALLAFVAGFETAVRVALAAGPSQYDAGWHVTGTVGHIGAAVAAARVLGADIAQTTAALGTGATQAAGMKAVYGSMGKSLHAGKAASDGVLSGVLSVEGFTSSPTAIEGHRGFLHLFSADPAPDRCVDGLGSTWTLPDNGFKAHACGSLTHPSVDAVLWLRDQHRIDPDDVDVVDVHAHDYVVTTTGIKEPADGLESKFSIYHCVAVALVDGRAGLGQFTTEKAHDPKVLSLRGRVRVHHDPDQDKDSAAVVITLVDGRTFRHEVEHNKGTPGNPMDDAELEAKFLDCAAPVVGAGVAQRIAALCWSLDEQEDVTDLMVLTASEVTDG